ncbi:MAG: bifunctional riboflavin kinase/FAD synthetase [Bacteroidota bacterium]|nr:bifunctional riboflavin kinase/FAD synthetase [Bacteroidota bacterium]
MITQNLKEYNSTKPSVITVGTFDGIHIGHKEIINELCLISKKKKLKSIILSFSPHPKIVLKNSSDIMLINSMDEKVDILNKYNLDYFLIKEFTIEFSRLTALEFVRDILVNKLNVKHIIVGYDHHFGRNRDASIIQLKEFGELYNFEITEIKPKKVNNNSVSSTKIRNLLLDGNLELANKYLDSYFSLTGLVIKGMGRGKNLGFPTANIKINDEYKLIPRNGVYIVKSLIDSIIYFGMMNIGENPTFDDKNKSIEIHFFELDYNIYDKKIKINILNRIRDEKKFK